MSSVLEHLRHETRALHDAVESTTTMRAATERVGDAIAHGDYLAALALGVWPLVRALLDSPGRTDPSLLPDPGAWARLGADLSALGRALPEWGGCPVPTADSEGAWGRLYVVRGAEAGVTVLARQLAKSEKGRALPSTFASHLASRRGEWPALCAALGGLPPSAAQRAADVARGDFQFVLASITAWERERMGPMVA